MENAFKKKEAPDSPEPAPGMEMRSLAIDQERIKLVKPYFFLKNIIEGVNDNRFLEDTDGAILTAYNVDVSPNRLVSLLLKEDLDVSGYYIGFRSKEGRRIRTSKQFREEVRGLPKDQLELLNLLLEDSKKLEQVESNLKTGDILISILQGTYGNRFLEDTDGAILTAYNVDVSPNRLVSLLLKEDLDVSGYYIGFRSKEGRRIRTSKQFREEVRGLPKDFKETLIAYSKSQTDENAESNTAEFDQARKEYATKKAFFTMLKELSSFDDLVLFIQKIENQDNKDQQMIIELTEYAFQYRRQNTVDEIYFDLTRENPDFKKIEQNINILAKSNSAKDRGMALTLASLAVDLELLRNEKNLILAINFNTPFSEIEKKISEIPVRPQVGENPDPLTKITATKEKIKTFYRTVAPLQSLDSVASIREKYQKEKPEIILLEIDALPEDDNFQIETKNLVLREYRDYLVSNSLMNDSLYQEIDRRFKIIFDEEYNLVELGKNEPAKKYLMENFSMTFFPLFQSLRGSLKFKEKLEDYIVGTDEEGVKKRLQFVQLLKELEKQRPLTDIERVYIKSVEQLTKFNPYLVALTSEAPGETDEYLRNHFDTLSMQTWKSLEDGAYVPALQIGAGPDGLSFFGEIGRYKPDLAGQILIVDAGNQPGGPFAIPNGPAWELNSANSRGKRKAVMPDSLGPSETKTVRAYGSPVARWYPGERKKGDNIRQGSINTTVDYLPTPDDLSSSRYPTNEELQIMIAVQSAMLFRQATFDTKLLKVIPNTDKTKKGDKIAILEKTLPNGNKSIKEVYTDAIFDSSGGGDPYYGFDIKNSEAENVLEKTKESQGFPKISVTLTALRAFADRRNENIKPPKTIVMSGAGNSTDVLIEYIASLFASGNALVRDVEKIYIIAKGNLSSRPRYARINDVKAREGTGRGNLIEFIDARVGDVSFEDPETLNPEKEDLVIYNEKKELIKNAQGEVVKADAFIANAGFEQKVDQVYSAYLNEDESLSLKKSKKRPTKKVVLPTNKKVPVADQLLVDENILFVGTASNPGFDSIEKLAQLPKEAREALLRNGAENAVAIGFRAPDAQAAARIFIDNRDIQIDNLKPLEKRVLQMEGDSLNQKNWQVEIITDVKRPRVSNNVSSDDDLLSSLVVYQFCNTEVVSADGQPVTAEYNFEIVKDASNKFLNISYTGTENLNSTLTNMVNNLVKNKYFENYTISGLRKKRLNPKLSLVLKFRNGTLDPRNSIAQIG